MSILNSFFSNPANSTTLKLRFSKKENVWRVTKGYDIMYMGEKQQCKSYMQHADGGTNYIFMEVVNIMIYQLRNRFAL